MTVIAVPYHLDEYLPDLDLPIEAAEVVTAEFPPGGAWERLAVLYDTVARAVAADAGRGGRSVVLTGDCAISLGIVAGLQRAGTEPGVVSARTSTPSWVTPRRYEGPGRRWRRAVR